MQVLVIGNPISGGGRARRRIEALSRLLRERGHAVEVFLTKRAGDAGARVSRLADGVERIAVVGGDGTLNEVLNGLPDPSRVPIAQLPTGTANILARELSLPFHARGTVGMLERGDLRKVDMGLVGERRFLLVASAGFDALVTKEIRRERKGRLGFRGYVGPILRVLRDYVPPDLRVTIDEKPAPRCQLVIASNTKNYGGLFTISKETRCDSGQLDVFMFSKASAAHLLRYGLQAFLRSVSRGRGVLHMSGSRVRIESEPEVAVEVDGDYFGSTPIELELRPRVVPVVVPAGA